MGRPTKCNYCKNDFIREDKIEDALIDKAVCPLCNIDYCNKLTTERNLFVLQDQYVSKTITVDQFINKIYPIMLEYTKSLILGNFRNRLHDSDDLENYTIQALHYFFIYFLKDPEFVITTSFSGMVYHKIVQSFNEKDNRDSADYSLDFKYDDGNEVSYTDTKKDDMQEIEEYENKFDLLKHILKLIFDFEKECNNKRENFVRLQAVYHYLNFGEKKADNLFKQYGRFSKLKFEDTLEQLHNELKKLYKEV